jgi:diguanylate cyclase (GGDEF)-like protein
MRFIQRRTAFMAGLFAIVASGLVVLASWGMQVSRNELDAAIDQAYQIAGLNRDAGTALREQDAALSNYVLTLSSDGLQRFQQSSTAAIAATQRLTAAAESLPSASQPAAELASAEIDWQTSFAAPAITAAQQHDTQTLHSLFTTARAGPPLGAPQLAAVDQATDDVYNNAAERAAALYGLRAVVTGLLVAVVLLGIGLAYVVIRRSVTKPLVELARTAEAVERGEAASFDTDRRDEMGILGRALEHMHRSLRRENTESGLLNRFTEVTSFAPDDASVAVSALNALKLLVSPDAGVAHLLNQSKDRAVPEATFGDFQADVLPLHALEMCPGIVRGSIYVTPDAAEPLAVHCPVMQASAGTLACVPLSHGDTVGAIHLLWSRTDALPIDSRGAVLRIAEHAALAMGNRRLLAALTGMASTDPRTGLANVRAFDTAVEEGLTARTGDESLAVLMLDLDRFKEFNDRYGHPAGDLALRTFASVLQDAVRAGDVAARYGGEEFAVYLKGAGLESAVAAAERIRSRTEATILSLAPGVTDRVTVSVGVAAAPVHGTDRVTLLRLADAALYRAKAEGRNRVISAGGPDISAAFGNSESRRTLRDAAAA